jgi:selenocysteine lyase/cysteine desulfurase
VSAEVARRAVLGAGALTGLGLLAGCTSDGKAAATTPASAGPSSPASGAGTAVAPGSEESFDPSDWASVRAQFPLDPEIAQFAAFVLAAHPAPVARAIQTHRAGLDFDTEGYLLTKDFESEVREAAAAHLDVQADQVALTDSATMGLGLLYTGLDLHPGDEVVTTTHDFYSTHESLALAAQRTGARVRRIKLYDEPARAGRAEIVSRVERAIGPRTRVLAITWVHSGTGVRLPVDDIAAAVAEANQGRSPAERVIVCVDGVHGFGLINATMPELGCDFFVSGTHKWLFGPRGTGVLWGQAWDRVRATIPNFSGAPPQSPGGYHTPGGYHSFEHRWAAKEAFELHAAIGAQQIEDRTLSQAGQLKEGLAAIDGVKVVTPMAEDLSASIVCIELGD